MATAAGGVAEYIQWSCRRCNREISVELRMTAAIFSADFGGAMRGSSSGTDNAGGADNIFSGAAGGGSQILVELQVVQISVELQVVQRRYFQRL